MKIELRPYIENDCYALATLANNRNVSRYLRDCFPYPYSYNDAISFVTHILSMPIEKGIEFAIIVDDNFAGAIGASFKDDMYYKTCELGYWLGEPYWGQGIMDKAVKLMADYIFDNFSITKISAEVFSNNIGSQKVLEKNNFELEGTLKKHVFKNGQYMDLKIYGLLKDIF